MKEILRSQWNYILCEKDWLKANEVLSLTDQKEYLVARSAFGDLMFFVVKEDEKPYFALLNVLNNDYQVISTADIAKFFRRSLNDEHRRTTKT